MKQKYVYVGPDVDSGLLPEQSVKQSKTYYKNLIYIRFKLNLATCKILIRRTLPFKDKSHIKNITNDVEYISSLSGRTG